MLWYMGRWQDTLKKHHLGTHLSHDGVGAQLGRVQRLLDALHHDHERNAGGLDLPRAGVDVAEGDPLHRITSKLESGMGRHTFWTKEPQFAVM